jgi:hypothetical protein
LERSLTLLLDISSGERKVKAPILMVSIRRKTRVYGKRLLPSLESARNRRTKNKTVNPKTEIHPPQRLKKIGSGKTARLIRRRLHQACEAVSQKARPKTRMQAPVIEPAQS